MFNRDGIDKIVYNKATNQHKHDMYPFYWTTSERGNFMRYSYEFKRKCVEMYRQGLLPDTPNGISKEQFRREVEKQIEIAFDQAQKEVDDLRQRTKEGLETARINGKQIGRVKGHKYITKKELSSAQLAKMNTYLMVNMLT